MEMALSHVESFVKDLKQNPLISLYKGNLGKVKWHSNIEYKSLGVSILKLNKSKTEVIMKKVTLY